MALASFSCSCRVSCSSCTRSAAACAAAPARVSCRCCCRSSRSAALAASLCCRSAMVLLAISCTCRAGCPCSQSSAWDRPTLLPWTRGTGSLFGLQASNGAPGYSLHLHKQSEPKRSIKYNRVMPARSLPGSFGSSLACRSAMVVLVISCTCRAGPFRPQCAVRGTAHACRPNVLPVGQSVAQLWQSGQPAGLQWSLCLTPAPAQYPDQTQSSRRLVVPEGPSCSLRLPPANMDEETVVSLLNLVPSLHLSLAWQM